MCYEGSGSSSGGKVRACKPQQTRTWQDSHLKEAFDLLDRDRDGTIKAEDLSSFVQCSLKSSLSAEDIDRMISLADRDGNGAVDFEEFLSLVQSHVPRAPESLSSLGHEALWEMFRMLDRNGDGVLCSEDLGGVMGMLGQVLSVEDLTAMLETATGSGEEKVTFEDFCRLMSSTPAQ